MRIDELFASAASQGTTPVSFEMFPPKGELTLERAREVGRRFAELSPSFVSVTYSAGGSTNNAATTQIASMLTRELGITSCAHQTCISLHREDLPAKIAELRAAGIENVLALRGDVPADAPTGPGCADYRYAMATSSATTSTARLPTSSSSRTAGRASSLPSSSLTMSSSTGFASAPRERASPRPSPPASCPLWASSRSAAWCSCAGRRCPRP